MGNPNCCAQCFRILFVAVNALFLLIGLALVGVGVYSFVSLDQYEIVSKSQMTSGGIILIVSGLVTAAIAGIGFVGACMKWRPLLVVYVIILTIIVLLEITAGVLGLVFKDKVNAQSRETYADAWNTAVEKYNTSDSNTKAIDSIQKYLKCCGRENYTSWVEDDIQVPESCDCPDGRTDCETVNYEFNGRNITQRIYKTGCVDAVLDYAQKIEYVVGGVGVAFGIFEIIGIIIAIGLIVWISKGSSDGYQVV